MIHKRMNRDGKTFIIAEAGVNHNGSLGLAKKLVDAALEAGADAIKFQSFKAQNIAGIYAEKAGYQKQYTDPRASQLEMLKKLELDENAHRVLFTYCSGKPIIFMSSPFDLESIDLLVSLGLEIFKIPSGEITNLPYLRKIGALQKQVILSTGMSDTDEIRQALDILVLSGTSLEKITVLHCNTEYPTPMKDVNLSAMNTISNLFNVNTGYSDHTRGIEVPIAAVALGASVIEKHLTLDKEMDGPDHRASLDPGEFAEMVRSIRNIEKAHGDGIKIPSPSETRNREVVRKSIVAACNISKGEAFCESNITVKRPGFGISPMMWDHVIGRTATRDYLVDELISLE